MRIVIAGSRSLSNPKLVAEAIEASGFPVTEVVSGGARGIDRLGEQWARHKGLPVKKFEPNWRPDGPSGEVNRAAGHDRNRAMADYADGLIAIWDGVSPGTLGMIQAATERGLAVYVHRVSDAAD